MSLCCCMELHGTNKDLFPISHGSVVLTQIQNMHVHFIAGKYMVNSKHRVTCVFNNFLSNVIMALPLFIEL